MSRKLRFLSDQINKAGLTSSPLPALQPDFTLEELEVTYSSLSKFFCKLSYSH